MSEVIQMDRITTDDAVRLIENAKQVTVGEVVRAIGRVREMTPGAMMRVARRVRHDLLGTDADAERQRYAREVRKACDKIFPGAAKTWPCRWPECGCSVQMMTRIRAEMVLSADEKVFSDVEFPAGALL